MRVFSNQWAIQCLYEWGKIGGNFLDQGGSATTYNGYTAGFGSTSILFSMNGGATQRTLSINRTLNATIGDAGVRLVTNFEIGDGTTNENDLLLFHYTGTLTATPTLGTVDSSVEVDSLYNDGAGNIYIRFAAIPEPGKAALLLGAFGGLLVWTVRRKRFSKI
ncbi:MAG: hypothetical protein ABI615_05110 [Chthoniobacterales bacterium]